MGTASEYTDTTPTSPPHPDTRLLFVALALMAQVKEQLGKLIQLTFFFFFLTFSAD